MKQLIAARTTALRKLKQKVDKMQNEFGDYEGLIQKMKATDLPPGVAEFYLDKLNKFSELMNTGQKLYADEIMKPDKLNADSAKSSTLDLEADLRDLETGGTDFNKKEGKDMAAIAT